MLLWELHFLNSHSHKAIYVIYEYLQHRKAFQGNYNNHLAFIFSPLFTLPLIIKAAHACTAGSEKLFPVKTTFF